MVNLNQVYRCKVCGNVIEVIHAGVGILFCCNQSMMLMTEKKEDLGNEKHVSIIEKSDSGFNIRVGSVEHPMNKEHFIEWIELITENEVYRKYLKPGQKPEARFNIVANEVRARIFCNIHGLWSSK